MKQCLIVDDSHVIREVGQRIFEQLGFEAGEAEDAEIALAICNEKVPEVILLDENLPDMGCIEFIRALHRIRGGMRAAVIVMLTENNVATITEALDTGACNFLMKPFDRESIEEKISELVLNESPDEASA